MNSEQPTPVSLCSNPLCHTLSNALLTSKKTLSLLFRFRRIDKTSGMCVLVNRCFHIIILNHLLQSQIVVESVFGEIQHNYIGVCEHSVPWFCQVG